MTDGLLGEAEANGGRAIPPTRQLEVPDLGALVPLGAPAGLRAGLGLAALLFGYGVVVPLLLVAWLSAAALLSAGAGLALRRAGGLEHDVFARCTAAGAAVVVLVLAAICLAWVLRLYRSSFFARPAGGFIRHPVPLAALGLLAALVAATALAGSASPAARYAVTTVVLANSYFFALLVMLGSLLAINGAWRRLHRWSVASAARAGLCAALLTAAGAAGATLQHLGWRERPAAAFLTHIDLAPLARAQSAIELQERALCLAAGERRAGRAQPPACAARRGR